jgi:cobalt-precorrin-5B (C1)-methyltransferase
VAGRKRKDLRSGFTTGTAAAAATKAALLFLVKGRAPQVVDIGLPTGDRMGIKVNDCHRMGGGTAVCSVIKDGGDDPDVTNGAEIGALVVWRETRDKKTITIRGGRGVGRVTKPGLETPPGEPAINSGPRKMIRLAVEEVLDEYGLKGDLDTEIFVPRGEELARHTLNSRLGIVGGISILGTTGIVRPMSHEAYTATIKTALSVAKANGLSQVVLTTGRRSERFSQRTLSHISDEGYVQIGDYFAEAMEMVAAMDFSEAILAVFFGKAVKMSQGIPHTHARSARLTLGTLAGWCREIIADAGLADRIAGANTARHAFDMFKDTHPELIAKVGMEVVNAAISFGRGKVDVRAIIFGFDGDVRFDSRGYRP